MGEAVSGGWQPSLEAVLVALRDMASLGLIVVALTTVAVSFDFAYDTITLRSGQRRAVAGDVAMIVATGMAVAGAALAGALLLLGALG